MTSNPSLYGHAYTRLFTYTEDGIYCEFEANGGVNLLHGLMYSDPVNIPSAPDKLRKHVYELRRLKRKQHGSDKNNSWVIARELGSVAREGEKTATLGSGDNLVVWDEGFGGLSVPSGSSAVLWASDKVLPEREQFAKIASACFLFLSADVLRGAGALISRQISWERSATELMWQIQNNPALSYLLKAPHILISFAEDGAVHIWRANGELKAELILAHGGGEGTLRGESEVALQSGVDDSFILMTASLARRFPAILSCEQSRWVKGVLKQAESFLTSGYTRDNLRSNIYPPADESDDTAIAFEIPLAPGQVASDPDCWCVSNNVSGKRIFDTAFEYVVKGAEAIENLPRFSFGALTTVDRWEIESFQNIRNLIVGYAAVSSVRPLSIAVFGSPGSGKSFGVTQIAKNVLPGKVEKLEFNVSQFTGLADLGAAFQRVRDVILEGKLPLVFFDEFDSDRDGLSLGWLKSFLMPMQDGRFKDGSGEHPLGKCILVFAGGTAASFVEFVASLRSEKPEEQQAFKAVKGPDFVSRLKGTIDVLGPNPTGEDDKNYILRRALLLRSLCERKLNIKRGIAPVSANIIQAMLLVPSYKHGARSMEAILDMSRLEDNVWEPVSLPFYSQLSLHVDADAFIRLVLREVILNSYLEQLAQAIHADFRKKITARDQAGAPYDIPWEQLPEDIKDSNREQAASFAGKLSDMGYSYDAGDTPFPSVEAFSQDEILLLAQNEHLRWIESRRAHGWTYGEVRDDEKKIHPLIIPWEDLSAEEQQKDVDVIENLIPLLASVGLRVYRTI
jgi:hypothetical protein